jgi:hypothetical protein
MKEFYKTERQAHIALVNDCAKKLGLSFPEHDADKITEPMLSEIAPFAWCRYNNLPAMDEVWIKSHHDAIRRHKKSNPHHPEYWKNISDMTEIAIIEMCCDWSAVNKNPNHKKRFLTAMDFYKTSALPEYGFTKQQQEIIERTLQQIDHK